MREFLSALFAATASVRDGDVDEAEVCEEYQMDDRAHLLTVSIRRFNRVDGVVLETDG